MEIKVETSLYAIQNSSCSNFNTVCIENLAITPSIVVIFYHNCTGIVKERNNICLCGVIVRKREGGSLQGFLRR